MRLVRFEDDRTGALAEGRSGTVVVDLTTALATHGRSDWTALIERWPSIRASLEVFVEQAGTTADGDVVHDLEAVRLRPPLPRPTSRIFALGVNFTSHVAGASAAVGQTDPTRDDTRPPAGFFVIPGTVVGHDDEISPPADAQKVDYEAEVAVVLASGGRNLAPEDVRIWGHTGFNDVSIRDPHLGLSRLDEGALAWGLQKNFQGGNVLGPWLAVDEGHDLTDLRIRSSVNGQLRQDGSTSEMIRSFADAVAYLSRYLPLQPGDLLTSGTPAGTAIEQGIDGPFLRPGDVIEVEIEGAGVLRNTVAAPISTDRMVEITTIPAPLP
jgi:2-keto-4-pentenoate hydratase/2-oxohepta-3-ene-1,7-dioic acid hydratase in catechol pathway